MNWYQQQKMLWITDCLLIYGFINRRHLVRKFVISEQQATKDLVKYTERFPGAMQYDPRRKSYIALTGPEAQL
ncbi:MAG: hypothetical protein COA47_05945 [Robiginitomaculum sp.]|nr:MAG: hypothetical protein COA47_05945 [Robiginitomaculum sp.]